MQMLACGAAWGAIGQAKGMLDHAARPGESPPQVSGIYPHLAMFNEEGECGTGARACETALCP